MKSHYRGMNLSIANQIRDLYLLGPFTQNDISSLYGISQGNVSRIVNDGAWCDLPGYLL